MNTAPHNPARRYRALFIKPARAAGLALAKGGRTLASIRVGRDLRLRAARCPVLAAASRFGLGLAAALEPRPPRPRSGGMGGSPPIASIIASISGGMPGGRPPLPPRAMAAAISISSRALRVRADAR